MLGALETLTRKVSLLDPFSSIFVESDGACDLSVFKVLSGLKELGEVFGRLAEMSGELMSSDTLAELSLGLLDVKSLLS